MKVDGSNLGYEFNLNGHKKYHAKRDGNFTIVLKLSSII